MQSTAFWKKDWFLAIVIAVFFVIASSSAWLQSIERQAYDIGLRSAQGEPSDRIAIIAIDDESLANIGRWPWPRNYHANMVDLLSDAGAKTIGYTAFLFEPQEDPGLTALRGLSDYFDTSGLTTQRTTKEGEEYAAPGPNILNLRRTMRYIPADQRSDFAKTIDEVQQPIVQIQSELKSTIALLDADESLRKSMSKADNVLLPMYMYIDNQLGNPDSDLPEYISRNKIANVRDNINARANDLLPISTVGIEYPIEKLATVTSGMGHLNATQDIDGGIRAEPLLLNYYGSYYPSLSLLLAANSLNLETKDITANLGESVRLGNLTIGTDNALRMNTFFYADNNGQSAFSVDSFYDVISNKIPASKFKNKIVLIGATAAGLGSTQVTPINPSMAPVVTLAHSISSILQEDFYSSPSWSIYLKFLGLIIVTLFLMAGLPRLSAQAGALVSLGLLSLFFGIHFYLMLSKAVWVELMAPSVMLIVGYLLITTKRFLVTERGKERSDQESAESNRMLGLAFQGQGQLDMAFEKFRKCPKDEQLAEAMYSLALDYERKRQFAKAGNVFSYIYDFAPKFKDVSSRLDRNKKMEETIILGGAGGSATTSMQLDGEKPMLGRYQVNDELGKGAMGVVYKGEDPKISRTVAIKTMALSQEFEGPELEDVKERFFREAETAGRLNHPHIVTIYDAGEEHDLAYIAMEFLQGKDLSDKIGKDSLLKPGKVFEIIIKCASALHYAHSMNVVHRDIKPANIMYHAESNELKITDFGIARITDSSKTKTGTILGTPSYMSPEQLSGKRVDGRSDLFSLGVMLYQMLTGELPFKGDSMAALMFQIANEPHPPLSAHNPRLPKVLDQYMDKALAKDADDRFASGNEMASALKQTLAAIKSKHAAK